MKFLRMIPDNTKKRAQNVIGLVLIFGLWYGLSNSDSIPPLYLPSPQMVWTRFLLYSDTMPRHILDSMYRIIAGFLIGSLIGIVSGIPVGWNKTLANILEPVVEFIRPMPPLALIPLFILWFGIGDNSKIIVISFGAWVIMVVNTIEAVRNIDPLYLEAAKTLGANNWNILWTIIVPAIIPGVMGGIRVAAATSFGMNVAAEFMGTKYGFGYLIIEGRRFIMTDLLLVGVFLITFFSMIVNWLIKLVEKRLTRWMPRAN